MRKITKSNISKYYKKINKSDFWNHYCKQDSDDLLKITYNKALIEVYWIKILLHKDINKEE